MNWMTAFLDFPADEFDRGVAFWQRVTGYPPSSPRGDDEEFVTLIPPTGGDFLRLQRLGEGSARLHLDLHAEDIAAAGEAAVTAGARRLEQVHSDVVTLASPGGLTFCVVSHSARDLPAPTTWPGGHASYVDQVCLDIPPALHDSERRFWSYVTECGTTRRSSLPEFSRLVRPDDQHLRVLFQLVGESDGTVSAHLDWATTDRVAETARHRDAGAEVVEVFPHWTVMRGPVGAPYCITDRRPEEDG